MRFKLTGKVLAYLGAVCSGLAFGGVFAHNYSQIRKEYQFDLIRRLESHESNVKRLERYCARRDALFCFDAVSARTAWDSIFSKAEAGRLAEGCESGDQRACRITDSLRRIGTPESIWLQDEHGNDIPQSGDAAWPRVRLLDRPVSYRQWLDYSFGTLVHSGRRNIDVLCAASSELNGALVCLTYGNTQANQALGRIAYVIEQGGRVRTQEEHNSPLLLRFWQGYNLLRKDFDRVTEKIESESETSPEEKRMWSFLRKQEWQYLLTFNAFSVIAGIPSHEFLHAVYFSSPEYRNAVTQAISNHKWKMLPLRFFTESLYKTDSEYVVLNEMQAYALLRDTAVRFMDQNLLLKSVLTER
jgi:hypothetical protein